MQIDKRHSNRECLWYIVEWFLIYFTHSTKHMLCSFSILLWTYLHHNLIERFGVFLRFGFAWSQIREYPIPNEYKRTQTFRSIFKRFANVLCFCVSDGKLFVYYRMFSIFHLSFIFVRSRFDVKSVRQKPIILIKLNVMWFVRLSHQILLFHAHLFAFASMMITLKTVQSK